MGFMDDVLMETSRTSAEPIPAIGTSRQASMDSVGWSRAPEELLTQSQPQNSPEPTSAATALGPASNTSGLDVATTISTTQQASKRALELSWSPRKKRDLKDFGESILDALDIPDDEHEDFLEACQLLPQKLLITIFGHVLKSNRVDIDIQGTAYIQSVQFKEHISTCVQVLLLEPDVLSYKKGLTPRVLRHIRVNPGKYQVPKDLVPFLSLNAFATAISVCLVKAR
ncbi:hypothetical protein B0H34DRAFT_707682 [Crassisporium funariophilum]|nr:hypothetical protein B0H34DRAFT_707682 [Crassisporium funariophilum]